MDCDKLVTNINPCATTTPFRRWEEVGYIIPYADIRNVVISGADVNFDTVGNAYSVRDRRTTPFAGSGSEFVRGDKGSVTWTERVNFPALANSVENATIANMLANGGRVVVILKQLDYESTGKGKYQVFGIDGGLRIDTAPFDPYADAAWDITLIAERTAQSAVYLWDTDEATTEAKWALITQYEYITGLSIASGEFTPQVVYLAVDAEKVCKVILHDNILLNSINGIINYNWTGAAGSVTLIVPKDGIDIGMSNSDFIGTLTVISVIGELDLSACTGITSLSAPNATNLDCHGCTSFTSVSTPNATELYCGDCTSLTSISAPNATYIECSGCTSLTSLSAPNATSIDASGGMSLTSLSAPNATSIDASGCALTAVAIAAQLAATVANIADLSTVSIDFSGGTSAAYSTWSAQAQADAQTIITAGGAVTYNV